MIELLNDISCNFYLPLLWSKFVELKSFYSNVLIYLLHLYCIFSEK